MRDQNIGNEVPVNNISKNFPGVLNLNVDGPNPYFIMASFLVQVENTKALDYKIEKYFTVMITKKEDSEKGIEEIDDDNYQTLPV